MKKIILTGASGFLGRAVVKALSESNDNFTVHCIYNNNPLQIEDVRFFQQKCDLLDKGAACELIHNIKPTHLVHMAWYVQPRDFWTSSGNIVWLEASVYLFDQFCKNGGRVFIGAGSLAEYDWASGLLDDTLTPLIPTTLYGQSKKKLLDRLILLQQQDYKDVKIIWPRIGYFFGPNEPKEKLIPMMIHRLNNNEPILLASRNFQRPYAHVKYLGKVFERIINQDFHENIIFNLSATYQYSLSDICSFVQAELGISKPQLDYDHYPSKPLSLQVKTNYLSRIGLEVPDTFFKDLSCLIKTNM